MEENESSQRGARTSNPAFSTPEQPTSQPKPVKRPPAVTFRPPSEDKTSSGTDTGSTEAPAATPPTPGPRKSAPRKAAPPRPAKSGAQPPAAAKPPAAPRPPAGAQPPAGTSSSGARSQPAAKTAPPRIEATARATPPADEQQPAAQHPRTRPAKAQPRPAAKTQPPRKAEPPVNTEPPVAEPTPAKAAPPAKAAEPAKAAAPVKAAEPARAAKAAAPAKATPAKATPPRKTAAKKAAATIKAAAAEVAPSIVKPDLTTVPDEPSTPPVQPAPAVPESHAPAASDSSTPAVTESEAPAVSESEAPAVTESKAPAVPEGRGVRTEAWAAIIADPAHSPELLAVAATQTIGPRAQEWVSRTRAAYPTATPDAIARLAVRQFTRFGSVSSLFAAVAGSYAPIALLGAAAFTHAELALHLAAAYGLDPTDRARAADLLVLTRVHPGREDAEAALAAAEEHSYDSAGLTDASWRLGRMVAAQAGAWAVVRVVNHFFPGTSLLAATLTSRGAVRAMASRATLYYRGQSQLSQSFGSSV